MRRNLCVAISLLIHSFIMPAAEAADAEFGRSGDEGFKTAREQRLHVCRFARRGSRQGKTGRRARVISSLDTESFKPMVESFSKKYPFIKLRMDEIGGPEALQRFLLELKAGIFQDLTRGRPSWNFTLRTPPMR